MERIQTLNAISSVVRDVLTPDRFDIRDDAPDPIGILVRSAKIGNLEFNPSLRAIARAGAGVNNIPVQRCTEAGIVVFNTPGANANAVKELVFAAMLLSSRHLIEAIDWCQTLKGKGSEIPGLVEAGKKRFIGSEIKEKTLGVIGLGAIGVMVANEGYAMGLKVLGYDPFISIDSAWGLSRAVKRETSIEALLAQCDYVTVHVPLSDKTTGFIDASFLAALKPNATLLNFSRGELADNAAILESLEAGRLGRYLTDFPAEELIGVHNVICIPHLGASTPESEENCAYMAAEQLCDFIENGNIRNAVNLPHCVMQRSGEMRICIINRNTPNMIGQFTALLSERGANITNMMNRSRDDYAYTVIDLDEALDPSIGDELASIDGVIRVTLR